MTRQRKLSPAEKAKLLVDGLMATSMRDAYMQLGDMGEITASEMDAAIGRLDRLESRARLAKATNLRLAS